MCATYARRLLARAGRSAREFEVKPTGWPVLPRACASVSSYRPNRCSILRRRYQHPVRVVIRGRSHVRPPHLAPPHCVWHGAEAAWQRRNPVRRASDCPVPRRTVELERALSLSRVRGTEAPRALSGHPRPRTGVVDTLRVVAAPAPRWFGRHVAARGAPQPTLRGFLSPSRCNARRRPVVRTGAATRRATHRQVILMGFGVCPPKTPGPRSSSSPVRALRTIESLTGWRRCRTSRRPSRRCLVAFLRCKRVLSSGPSRCSS